MILALQTLALGCDSLLAGLLLGVWMTYRRGLKFAAALGVCDAIASLLGAAGTSTLSALATAVVLIFAAALSLRERSWIVVLPVLMSVDNFVAGRHLPDAVLAGCVSFALAFAGLALGHGLMRGVSSIRMGVAR